MERNNNMADLSKILVKTLRNLTRDDFKYFKHLLKEDGILEAELETETDKERWKPVDLMIQKYTGLGALQKTVAFLRELGKNQMADQLENFQIRPVNIEDVGAHHPVNDAGDAATQRDELEKLQQFAVDVSLDPDTAHPDLVLSKDGKRVHHSGETKDLPKSSKRFDTSVCVLAKEKFFTGIFYFEVLVKDKTAWAVGVARESINRKGSIEESPKKGFWVISRSNKVYEAANNSSVSLHLKSRLHKVGICVNYEDDLVSFYNVDTADHLYSFTDCGFRGNLLPYFCPYCNNSGANSAPLIICPVINKLDKAELRTVQQSATEVTLDPDTAHPELILSDDGKLVYHSDERKDLPNNPERFDSCLSVLGKQSFTSEIIYYEVQVEGKTSWTVGVVTKSIFRKGDITALPENGFWTISLKDDGEYEANDSPVVRLHPRAQLQKVGVFLDYDKHLVSFYSVDTADLLYTFSGCCFIERLLPYFCTWKNKEGSNSAPLIITSVCQDE